MFEHPPSPPLESVIFEGNRKRTRWKVALCGHPLNASSSRREWCRWRMLPCAVTKSRARADPVGARRPAELSASAEEPELSDGAEMGGQARVATTNDSDTSDPCASSGDTNAPLSTTSLHCWAPTLLPERPTIAATTPWPRVRRDSNAV